MLIFEKLGKKPISLEEYKTEFTLPYMTFWNKYFPDLTKEEEDVLFHETINKVKDPTIYTGAKETLDRLHSLGIKMVVLSSHPQHRIMKECKEYGVDKCFIQIHGSVHDKTEEINLIMKKHVFNSGQTAYVGDMTHDIHAGKKAGVKTIAITWGYQTDEQLRKENPDMLIHNITQLLDNLN